MARSNTTDIILAKLEVHADTQAKAIQAISSSMEKMSDTLARVGEANAGHQALVESEISNLGKTIEVGYKHQKLWIYISAILLACLMLALGYNEVIKLLGVLV